ncbi:MAG: hypothetical protein AUJ92_05880 [Armatimonadetes bacterium CG2_30_59_28]|nr:DUF4838 domain-containing protein [Armatimonadota bacterium]OIO96462.1 MAG: hypothetical protein AUJ92_05880 [Armatimonadetes bacterium CG2_30_59_28]PIU67015.1 MAG: hypothetical protein COS85_02290 [Armatimonadetes bacterium CG07_land_8_20_14_0_80_59_28]PIX43353.1 MAG: hypothetical protein COZ56_07310 [Armatimonadetes bacterium CG_4_8_14_3_um_filter_58_9]PJB70231.1 MAG: hypothetical protein CO095_09165 [Armatimonadetes bacterium CG_4_9_14_3_um_filter_58_7]
MTEKLMVWIVGILIGASVGASAKGYALVRDGKATSCIVLMDDAGPVEKHAASELSAYLEKITGARVETVSSPAAGKYSIYIGTIETKAILLDTQMRASAAKVGEEGYMLAADAGGLRIVGRKPIGVLYGIYGLLRRYANVRWFFPGAEGEYCPKKATFAVPAGVSMVNPSFSTRTLNLVCANINSNMTDTWDWMVRNGMEITTPKQSRQRLHPEEREKRGDENVGGGHAFSYLISDNLFDEHPEYFALMDGKRMKQEGQARQPCTSNPTVVEIMTQKLLEWSEIPPRGGTFLIGNNDSPGWCQCENCTRLDPPAEKEKSFVSTRYWTLLNEMAEKALAQNSDLKLEGWAYQNFQEPPVGIVPDKRFAVWACLHQRCYRHRMNDENCPSNRRFREDILLKWVKLNPTYTYEYTDCLPGGDVIYLPLEHVFADDLKYYHKIGVRGSLTETAPPDGVFGPTWNNRRTREMWLATWQFVYMMAYFLWDVDADYNTVYEDMGSKFYGVAWPAMKQYRGKLTKAYEETPGEMIYGTPNIALGKCPDRPGLDADLLKLLDDAEKAAGGNDALLKKIRREREYLDLSWRKMHEEYVAKSKLEVGASKRVGKVNVDGQLNEEDWKKADFITGFIAQKGDKADPQTFVRILYDNDNLFFGVESLEAQPEKMKTLATKRDGPLWTDNGVEFFIAAPIGNGKYLHLIVNSKGVCYDSTATGTGPAADVGFDSGADVKTAALPDRWVVEVRIPTSALGTTIKDGEVWKLNVARNRVLTDGTSQGSSLCDGAYHGVEAFRSVAFGGKGLIRNGDFEDVQKPSEWKQKTKWKFETDAAPASWSFHDYAGEAALLDGGAASGKKYLRIKSVSNTALAVIYQPVNLQAADSLLVRAKVRGKGVVRAVMFLYDPKTHRHLGSPSFGEELKVDSPNWTPFEAEYSHDGKALLSLALYFTSTEGIDIDDVTVVRGKKI